MAQQSDKASPWVCDLHSLHRPLLESMFCLHVCFQGCNEARLSLSAHHWHVPVYRHLQFFRYYPAPRFKAIEGLNSALSRCGIDFHHQYMNHRGRYWVTSLSLNWAMPQCWRALHQKYTTPQWAKTTLKPASRKVQLSLSNHGWR